MQVIPLPDEQAAFELLGKELCRYRWHADAAKPFLFPVLGPSGLRVTAIAHPYDPVGHGHHRSVWVGHRDVNGVNFWEEKPGSGRITGRIASFAGPAGTLVVAHTWQAADGRALVRETRTLRLVALEAGEYMLDLRLLLAPADKPVTLGATPFGFLGVRVAATMAVKDGFGGVVNAGGARNEAGAHWQRSEWLDYSGPVAAGVVNGIALFDHPSNPGHPTVWHVRDDGWMGAAFCKESAQTLDAPLELRYRLYVHGAAAPEDIAARYAEYAQAAGG